MCSVSRADETSETSSQAVALRFGILSQWHDPEPGSAAVPGVLARSPAAMARSPVARDTRCRSSPAFPTVQPVKSWRDAACAAFGRGDRKRHCGPASGPVAKLPADNAAEVMAHPYAIRDAPTLDAAQAAAGCFENTYAKAFPATVTCFRDDRKALLAIHWVPVRHRVRVRTTNLAERGFEEERRRTMVIPRLMSEQATLKLAFATVIRAAEGWCQVSSTASSATSSGSSAPSSASIHHRPKISEGREEPSASAA